MVNDLDAYVFTFTAFKVLFQVFVANPWGSISFAPTDSPVDDRRPALDYLYEFPAGETVDWPQNGAALDDDATDTIASRFRDYRMTVTYRN